MKLVRTFALFTVISFIQSICAVDSETKTSSNLRGINDKRNEITGISNNKSSFMEFVENNNPLKFLGIEENERKLEETNLANIGAYAFMLRMTSIALVAPFWLAYKTIIETGPFLRYTYYQLVWPICLQMNVNDLSACFRLQMVPQPPTIDGFGN